MEKKPWYKDKVFDQIWLRFLRTATTPSIIRALPPAQTMKPYEVSVYLWNK